MARQSETRGLVLRRTLTFPLPPSDARTGSFASLTVIRRCLAPEDMCSDRPISHQPGDGAAARAAGLIAVAEDLAGEFSRRPLLERILRRCTGVARL